jgi:hypothetical protein
MQCLRSWLNWRLESLDKKKTTFSIEVEDRPLTILLVQDGRGDMVTVSWQDAVRLADVLDQVIADVGDQFIARPYRVTLDEQSQLRLTPHLGLVTIVTGWTDRVRFTSIDAVKLVTQALRKVAQDSSLQERGIIIEYNREGFIKRIHDLKTDATQVVRGN